MSPLQTQLVGYTTEASLTETQSTLMHPLPRCPCHPHRIQNRRPREQSSNKRMRNEKAKDINFASTTAAPLLLATNQYIYVISVD